MAPRKSERIMNLAICLLLARRFLDKNHLREVVEGYGGLSDAAFERTFERDKDDLRAMGVPVETGSNSTLFPDEIGYRIRRQDFELPPIDPPFGPYGRFAARWKMTSRCWCVWGARILALRVSARRSLIVRMAPSPLKPISTNRHPTTVAVLPMPPQQWM